MKRSQRHAFRRDGRERRRRKQAWRCECGEVFTAWRTFERHADEVHGGAMATCLPEGEETR